MRWLTPVVLVALLSGAAAADEARIAVLEFTSASNDPELAPLGKGLQSMVTTDLAGVQALQVVERERLADVQAELARGHGAGFDRATAARLGKLVGASHLFVGSYTVVGNDMRLDGRLIAVASGEVLLAEHIAGEKAYFFELEQKLVQKVIAALGVKLAPKEKAALARAHTADFKAFQRFSEGLRAHDDGRLDDAVQALREATALDHDFKLAALTLEEYEVLAAQVRAKAAAAGRVERETERAQKDQALAAELAVVKALWAIRDTKRGDADARLRRVAAGCVLAAHYHAGLAVGDVRAEAVAAADFDAFTLQRTGDALLAQASAEAWDLFPRIAPLCQGFSWISTDMPKGYAPRTVDAALKDEIERSARSAEKSYFLSSMEQAVEHAASALHLDAPGQARLADRLYALAQRLPGLTDDERARCEEVLAERHRRAGDFDAATQRIAAVSRRTTDSGRLEADAAAIERNRKLKLLVGAPGPLREYYLGQPDTSVDELERLGQPRAQKELADRLEGERDIGMLEETRAAVLVGDLPVWRLTEHSGGWTHLRTGPRSSALRSDEVRYDGAADVPPTRPELLVTDVRGRRVTVRVQIDGSAAAGVAFALDRLRPVGGTPDGAPAVPVGYAVLVHGDRVRLARLRRKGTHRFALQTLAEQAVGAPRPGRRPVEVGIDPGSVAVTVDGQRVAFPWKPDGDGDGFIGLVFAGAGTAALAAVTASGR